MKTPETIRQFTSMEASYAEISKLAKEHTVVIKVNGKEDTVVIDYENWLRLITYIEDLENETALFSHLLQGAEDIRLGKTTPAEEAFAAVLDELENME